MIRTKKKENLSVQIIGMHTDGYSSHPIVLGSSWKALWASEHHMDLLCDQYVCDVH